MNKKIDLSIYEGHTEGPWESEEWDEGKILGPISERHRNNHPVVAVVGAGWWGDMMPECNANLRLMTDAPLILGTALRATKRLEAVESMLRRSGFWVSQEGWDESDKDDEMLVSLDYLIQYYQDLKDSSEGSEGDHMHTRSIGDTDFGQGNGELESNYGDGQPEWYSGPNM